MTISLLLTAQGVWTRNQQLFFAFLFNLTVKEKERTISVSEIQIFAHCTFFSLHCVMMPLNLYYYTSTISLGFFHPSGEYKGVLPDLL